SGPNPLTPDALRASAHRQWLGYQDSNLEWLNQNQLCCQLHHTPLATYNHWSQAFSALGERRLAAAAFPFGPTCRLPKDSRVLSHASAPAYSCPARSRRRVRSLPSSSSD